MHKTTYMTEMIKFFNSHFLQGDFVHCRERQETPSVLFFRRANQQWPSALIALPAHSTAVKASILRDTNELLTHNLSHLVLLWALGLCAKTSRGAGSRLHVYRCYNTLRLNSLTQHLSVYKKNTAVPRPCLSASCLSLFTSESRPEILLTRKC